MGGEEVIEYMVVEAPKYGTQFTNDFASAMKSALDEGWRPIGGIQFIQEGRIYLQAMIRETE